MRPAKPAVERARELGLPILGEVDMRVAVDGVVVRRALTHQGVERMASEGYRTTPSGPKHTIVERVPA